MPGILPCIKNNFYPVTESGLPAIITFLNGLVNVVIPVLLLAPK